ncbi:metallophosphoesterase family protein [uncultured Aureimonas sp.]|uniref:metallophosphoesterase family protein n=1 Tax=uncultured Aureimonas sp. TaxID=1604662 RepID=UPI0025CE7204|nr:metallophosphoesterase family protein [uncultured Aureimonas sp.]
MGLGSFTQMLKDRLPRRAPRLAGTGRAPRRRLDIAVDPIVTYAIGDIHGCIDKLRRLERRIVDDAAAIERSKLLVFLGDYLDRGTGSAAVIEHLMAPPPEGFSRICLCGNHEEALIDVLDGRRTLDDWLRLGGERTLMSYGYDVAYMAKRRRTEGDAAAIVEALPASHIEFLRQLPVTLSTPSYLFVHAGVRPGIELSQQRDEDLLWIREPFLSRGPGIPGRLVVHGHTPAAAPIVQDQRVGVDTGAYAGGPLTAVRLADATVTFLDDR